MEHGHGSRDLANELHVVLDDDDRGGFVQIEHQSGCPGRLLVAHARRGLVEEHDVRFANYDHRDFDPLTLPVGEFSDEAPEDRAEVQPLDDCVDGGAYGRALAARPGREPQVFAHREAVHNDRHLILDADAAPPDRIRLNADNVLTFEQNAPAGRADLASEHLEECTLARAVRPNQTAQLAPA